MSGPRRGMLAILVPDWCEFRAPLDSPEFMSPVFSAFGLALRFHAPLPGTGATTGRLDATVRLAVGEPGELSAVWTGASGPPHWETDLTDGSRVSLVPGRGGDWLLQTPTAAFCFSADLHTVLRSRPPRRRRVEADPLGYRPDLPQSSAWASAAPRGRSGPWREGGGDPGAYRGEPGR